MLWRHEHTGAAAAGMPARPVGPGAGNEARAVDVEGRQRRHPVLGSPGARRDRESSCPAVDASGVDGSRRRQRLPRRPRRRPPTAASVPGARVHVAAAGRESFFGAEPTVTVRLRSEPDLAAGDRLVLYLDGKRVDDRRGSYEHTLSEPVARRALADGRHLRRSGQRRRSAASRASSTSSSRRSSSPRAVGPRSTPRNRPPRPDAEARAVDRSPRASRLAGGVTWPPIPATSSARRAPRSASCSTASPRASSGSMRDGAVLHLNEPAEDLFGISRNQAAGRAIRDLLKANARARRRDHPRARRRRAVLAPRAAVRAGPGRGDALRQRHRHAVRRAGLPGRLAGRDRRRHAAPAHPARERAAHAARRQPRDGSAARARDQESARRPARRGAAARAAAQGRRRCTNTRR